MTNNAMNNVNNSRNYDQAMQRFIEETGAAFKAAWDHRASASEHLVNAMDHMQNAVTRFQPTLAQSA